MSTSPFSRRNSNSGLVRQGNGREFTLKGHKVKRGTKGTHNLRPYCACLVSADSKNFGMYGGDDGARTRDLCRDRAAL